MSGWLKIFSKRIGIIPLLRLWRAAHNLDSRPSTEEEKEQEDNESSFFIKKQNEELKKANKELWKRVEELQKEKTSFAEENAKLKLEIDQSQSLPGNNSILESLPRP